MVDYEKISREYVRICIEIDKHSKGYIDAYLGPQDFRKEHNGKPIELGVLSETISNYIETLNNNAENTPRHEYLLSQFKALLMTVKILISSEVPDINKEANWLFDLKPHWVPETDFEEAQKKLNDLLPKGGNLPERIQLRDENLQIKDQERIEPLINVILDEFRKRTKQKYQLPEHENLTVSFVTDKPWGAYHWFLGNATSRVDFNRDLPIHLTRLINLVAHEAYPGHHTEFSIKEQNLVINEGKVEHAIVPISSPAIFVSEGIAVNALDNIIPVEELADWIEQDLFKLAGIPQTDARAQIEIDKALRPLLGANCNAVFLIYEQNKTDDFVIDYLEKYGLRNRERAEKTVSFIKRPLLRTLMFTYHFGRDLVQKLLNSKSKHPDEWFNKLLTETVTPSMISRWSN